LEPRDKDALPYPSGLGALTGGIVSAVYLFLISSALSNGVVTFPLVAGLVVTFMAATLLNSMVAGVVAFWRFRNTRGLPDYLSGAAIGTAVTYATVIFYFFSLV